jgi:hypothetical protein
MIGESRDKGRQKYDWDRALPRPLTLRVGTILSKLLEASV